MSEPRHAAVLGRPIDHSLSPLLHTAAYRALGLDWSYQAIDCGVAELPGVLAARTDWAGFSCTMPLKRAALEVAVEVRPRARAVGAANTLTPRAEGGWVADNTDVTGVIEALAEASVRPRTVTVLGAGATAQAVVAALPHLGVRACTVVVRDPARTGSLLATADAVGVTVRLETLSDPPAALSDDLVVSTLPAGAADPLAAWAFTASQAVLDVVYEPWPTALASSAVRGGATVVGGESVLLHQAAAQVELMTGRPAPLEAMREALGVARRDPSGR